MGYACLVGKLLNIMAMGEPESKSRWPRKVAWIMINVGEVHHLSSAVTMADVLWKPLHRPWVSRGRSTDKLTPLRAWVPHIWLLASHRISNKTSDIELGRFAELLIHERINHFSGSRGSGEGKGGERACLLTRGADMRATSIWGHAFRARHLLVVGQKYCNLMQQWPAIPLRGGPILLSWSSRVPVSKS